MSDSNEVGEASGKKDDNSECNSKNHEDEGSTGLDAEVKKDDTHSDNSQASNQVYSSPTNVVTKENKGKTEQYDGNKNKMSLVEVTTTKEMHEAIEIVYRNGQKEELCRKKVLVKFDWSPSRCNTCCVFGHTTQSCGKNSTVKESDKTKGWLRIVIRMLMMALWKSGIGERGWGDGKRHDNQQHNQPDRYGKKVLPKPAAQFECQPKTDGTEYLIREI
ncbi:hypothetical protein CTI12_AA123590 [Artemisia annua]|uniref:Zinc knuckle CX2CX4HX4C n=1 Tax=Artemisia annua TaxID=35608 RepID=A0A2U1PQX5_ARTAN|nr:hypothetical protein CTI12_AA123590 [Artemisia annua]